MKLYETQISHGSTEEQQQPHPHPLPVGRRKRIAQQSSSPLTSSPPRIIDALSKASNQAAAPWSLGLPSMLE
jgi:hypothetical protein